MDAVEAPREGLPQALMVVMAEMALTKTAPREMATIAEDPPVLMKIDQGPIQMSEFVLVE